jgi:hypothetical protein
VLSVPVMPPPTGAAFGGVTGATGMVPPTPVGATVPLSLPMELDPQAPNNGSDKTPSSSHRWLSNIFPRLSPVSDKSNVSDLRRPFELRGRYVREE